MNGLPVATAIAAWISVLACAWAAADVAGATRAVVDADSDAVGAGLADSLGSSAATWTPATKSSGAAADGTTGI